MFEEKTKPKGFFLGLIIGGAIGGILAFLYAPKSGKELRKNITGKKHELFKDAERYLENARNKASGFISEGKRKAESLLDEAKKQAGSIIQGSEKLYTKGKGKKQKKRIK